MATKEYVTMTCTDSFGVAVFCETIVNKGNMTFIHFPCSYSKELQLENLGEPSVFMTPLQRVSRHGNSLFSTSVKRL